MDRSVRVWDVMGGLELMCLRGHTHVVFGVHPVGTYTTEVRAIQQLSHQLDEARNLRMDMMELESSHHCYSWACHRCRLAADELGEEMEEEEGSSGGETGKSVFRQLADQFGNAKSTEVHRDSAFASALHREYSLKWRGIDPHPPPAGKIIIIIYYHIWTVFLK